MHNNSATNMLSMRAVLLFVLTKFISARTPYDLLYYNYFGSGSGSGSGLLWEEGSAYSGSGSGSGELWMEGSGASGSGYDMIPCEMMNCPPGTECVPGRNVCPIESPCFTVPTQCVVSGPCGITLTYSGDGSGEEGSGGSGECPPQLAYTKCGNICFEECSVDLNYICVREARCLCKPDQALFIKNDRSSSCVPREQCPCA